MVSPQMLLFAVWNVSMSKKNNCSIFCRRFRRMNCFCQLLASVCQHYDEHVSELCPWQGCEDAHCKTLEGFAFEKQFYMMFSTIYVAFPSAYYTAGCSVLDVVRHVRLVVDSPQSIENASFSWVSGHLCELLRMGNALSQRPRYGR